jgi:hypothetical protein
MADVKYARRCMKKLLGIALLSAALLAGCGGAAQPNTGADTGAGAATTTTGGDVSTIPTSETGSGEAADTAPDATAGANETAMTDTDTTAADTTAAATPADATSSGAANATPATDAVAQPTSATADDTSAAGAGTVQPTSATGDATGAASGAATAMPTAATAGETAGDTSAITPGAFQTVDVPELGLSFQVPEGWEQVANENAWSPAGMDVPRIGVNSADVTADWKPSSFLPQGATVKSSQQLTLGGMQTMFYTVENTDGTAETHAIMRSGDKAYDVYGRAASLQDLRTIQPVLNDIVGSVRLGGA